MDALLLPGVPSSRFSSPFTCPTPARPLFPYPSTRCALFCGFCSSRASPVMAASVVSSMPDLSSGGWFNKKDQGNFHKVVSARMVIPARDRIIDFGKYKGRMLGTLPSKYLMWVSKNLRARDFEEWAKLADEVLRDPIYRDRVEWESAERVLSGNGHRDARTVSPVSELLDISERFGWDNEDKVGWRRINFELLGTSMGGRIPRKGHTLDHGLTNRGIKEIDTSGNVHNNTASQRKKEGPQSFQNTSSVKTDPSGAFEAHDVKFEASTYLIKGLKSFESKRLGSSKVIKLSVLEQEKRKATMETEGFEDRLRGKRQQRRVKRNLLRQQQSHESDRDAGVVEDEKDGDLTATKQNDRSNASRTFNPFPGRGEILKKLNR